MNRSSVRQNELNDADVHADRHGACALDGAFAAKADHLLAIESNHVALSELPLQHIKRRSLGAERRLAHIAHIVDMKVNEFAEGLEARNSRLARCLAAVDLTFSICCPESRIVASQERLADVAALAADLDAPGARREFCEKWPFFVCAPCALGVS
ncbi:hypothetical protein [Mesorhizobium sp.]|uniref:hypothetical protein n=1 Tax=Mesorhizobium sp. TaxID=1871066 RepID=UPI0025C5668E|nr:hypothetical protein [Mesorhizobium sp.]